MFAWNLSTIRVPWCTFWRKSKLENWRRSRPRVSFYFCSWPCECDVNPRCASCIKVKMATESGKPLKLFTLKDLTGKQRRRGEKLSLFLRGERRVTARCSSGTKDLQRRGGTFFSRVLDLQTLCSLDRARAATMPEQVGYRRSTILTRGFFFDEYECAGF